MAPNVDTLYSIAHLDLAKGPIVLSHPDMERRYFEFQFLDPYTNVIGYAGTRTTGRGAGRVQIAWTRRPGRRTPGARLIRSPYRRVWVIGRTLATDTRADQRRARAKMLRYRLTPAPRLRSRRPGRPQKGPLPSDGLELLDSLGRALAQNPPPGRDRPLLDRLAQVGVGAGLRPSEAGLPADAVADGDGAFLTGANRYRLVFESGREPPARAFWSLTAYDSDGYLVRNPARRYAIGTSHPPLVRCRDGAIVVLIQRERPAARNVNWLPAPAAAFASACASTGRGPRL